MPVKQRADDLHAQMPTHEQVQEVRLEVTGYQNRIVDLERHKSEGGFGLDASAPQVQSERCRLERAEKELARLTVAGAFVADAAMTEHAPSGLIGTGGVSRRPVSLAQGGPSDPHRDGAIPAIVSAVAEGRGVAGDISARLDDGQAVVRWFGQVVEGAAGEIIARSVAVRPI